MAQSYWHFYIQNEVEVDKNAKKNLQFLAIFTE